MATKLLFLLVLTFLAPYTINEPNDKKIITENDYHKWSKISRQYISPNANWIAWQQKHPNLTDSLYLYNTQNKKIIKFKQTNILEFNEKEDHVLLYRTDSKETIVLNLLTNEELTFRNTKLGKFIFSDDYLLLETKNENKKSLAIFNIQKSEIEKQVEFKEYQANSDKSIIAYVTNFDQISLLEVSKSNKITQRDIITQQPGVKLNLTWSTTQNNLAFFEGTSQVSSKSRSHIIHYIKNLNADEKHFKMQLDSSYNSLKNFYVSNTNNHIALQITPDNKQVLFTISEKEEQVQNKSLVQIFLSKDPSDSSTIQKGEDAHKAPKYAMWNVSTNDVRLLTKDYYTSIKFYHNLDYAILYNPTHPDTNNNFQSVSDIYLQDLKSNNTKLLLKDFPTNNITSNKIPISTNSKFIAYYNNNDWYVYNIKLNQHTNITSQITSDTFFKKDPYKDTEDVSIQTATWTTNNRLLLQGSNAFWLYNPNNNSTKEIFHFSDRFTNVNLINKNITSFKQGKNNIQTFLYNYIDLNNILVSLSNNSLSGYFNFSLNKLNPFTFKEQKNYLIQKSKNKNEYIYLTENTDDPTTIWHHSNGKDNEIYQINNHQKYYLYPKKKLITYTNSKGRQLQGVLFYPTHFSAENKYPLITYIYEKQTPTVFTEYNIPSLFNPDGFNYINFTSNGYFVFYPDIEYVTGNPGYSALDCTLSGINKVIEMPYIDIQQLNLIGHSFGGYETTFIATQTNKFKNIVSGAALTDLSFHALTMDKALNISQTWRYLNYQMRMGKSPQQDYQNYLKNSPIFHINSLNSNLLSWSGEKDTSVDVNQSIALHLALKNIHKKHTLRIYPNEGHILIKPENQIDLYRAIQNHFIN